MRAARQEFGDVFLIFYIFGSFAPSTVLSRPRRPVLVASEFPEPLENYTDGDVVDVWTGEEWCSGVVQTQGGMSVVRVLITRASIFQFLLYAV